MNFVPDSGKYEIVSYICTCVGERVYLNTPLQRVATEVVGWTGGVEPLPVVLESLGLRIVDLPQEAGEKIGAPRLAFIGRAQLTHQELILMHRAYHEQD